MIRRPSRFWWPASLIAAILVPEGGAAQDIEAVARIRGRELPAAYYETIRQNPDFFRPRGGWIERSLNRAASGASLNGDLPVVVVAALFSDSPEPAISDQALQQTLFDGPSADGTLREFYTEVSGGRLYIAGQVRPWVRTGIPLAEAVGGNWGLGSDNRLGEFLLEALDSTDTMTDFGKFDNDGPDNVPNSGDDDGTVDALAFYFHEVAASCGGPGVWPHFSGMTPRTGAPYQTDDRRPNGEPIEVDPYFIQSAVDCSGSAIAPITTVAHELGHLIGLPDLYHPVDGLLPEQRRWVIGCWSLMAAGAWGCGNGDRTLWRRPTHLGAWEKKRLGWLDDVVVVDDREYEEIELRPVRTGGRILEIPLGEAERLLIEYRDRQSFDQGLPASGVLAYRINDTIPFRPCAACPPLYRVQLLEADGNATLTRTPLEGGNRGEPGDGFGVSEPGALTNLTDPSTRLGAGLGAESDVNLYHITVEPGKARLVISTTPLSTSRLLGPLLLDEANGLTAVEQEFLDRRNNRNGRYDVGDLRAYLQRR